jgi:hypothetical protein
MQGHTSQNKFHPEDLFETYVMYFFRRNVLGGMKGYDSPVADMSHWIVRTRYLLATIPGEHLDALFNLQDVYFSRESHCTAAFIAGLLNDTRHIERIGTLAQQGGNIFYSAAYFGALLLFKTQDAIQPVLRYLENPGDDKNDGYHNSRIMAITTLRFADQIHNTDFASPYKAEPEGGNEKRLLLRIIDFGNILRGGITFTQPDELQLGLLQLLNDTTSPFLVAHGLFKKPVIRKLWSSDLAQLRDHIDVAAVKQEYKDSLREKRAYKHPMKTEPKVPKNNLKFTNAVQQFLAGKKTASALEHAIRHCHHVADILAALETDLAYKIPLTTIEYAFEKLGQLVTPSYLYYEMYATHLLLRGTGRDEKARQLWAKAEAMRETIRWVEQHDFHYVMRETKN